MKNTKEVPVYFIPSGYTFIIFCNPVAEMGLLIINTLFIQTGEYY